MRESSGRQDVVCGIDIGSTNCKVVAMDAEGNVVARARQATPRSNSDLSIDADGILAAVEGMILEVCRYDYKVAAIASAGVGEDGVLVDVAGNPLNTALAWFDPRRTRLFEELEPQLSSSDWIGVHANPSHTLTGWLWASRQGMSDKAASWTAITDYACSRWTGRRFISDTLASRTAAWDRRTRSWLANRVEITLGTTELLPEVIPTGHVVGALSSPRLNAAGVIASGAMVIAGGHDHPIGGWAVDRLHDGAILDSMGTAEVVVAQCPTPNIPRFGTCDVGPGILNNGSTLLTVTELARNVDWTAQDPEVAAALHAIIEGREKPDDYLHSESFIPGGQGGVRPKYAPDAPSAPLSRASAVAGALARAGDAAIEAIASRMPADAPVYVAGGWARSPGWIDIKRSFIDTEVHVIPEPEVTAVGAALLAARAIGWDVDARTALAVTTTAT